MVDSSPAFSAGYQDNEDADSDSPHPPNGLGRPFHLSHPPEFSLRRIVLGGKVATSAPVATLTAFGESRRIREQGEVRRRTTNKGNRVA